MIGILTYSFMIYFGSIVAEAESMRQNGTGNTRGLCSLDGETKIFYVQGEKLQMYAWSTQNITSCRLHFYPMPSTNQRVCVCPIPVQLPWNGEIYTHEGVYSITYMTLMLYNRGNKAVCSQHGQPLRFRIFKEAFYARPVITLYLFVQSPTDVTAITVTMVILVSCLGVCILFGCIFLIWKLNHSFEDDEDDGSRKTSNVESSIWTTTLTRVDSDSVEYY